MMAVGVMMMVLVVAGQSLSVHDLVRSLMERLVEEDVAIIASGFSVEYPRCAHL